MARPTAGPAAPGFFGKVRSHGDFVGRRLPPAFLQRWDEWLQAGLLGSRHALGPAWLQAWLHGPIWRFALAPGLCGPAAWQGVMMPSLDRVGRYFPLTIAAPLDRAVAPAGEAWFATIEDLALGALEADFDLDAFDKALAGLAPPPGMPGAAGVGAAAGRSHWSSAGGAQVAPASLGCADLPTPAQFTALLDGRFRQRGW